MAKVPIPEAKDFFDAQTYENYPDIEKIWAENVVDHIEMHFNLITSVDPKTLKLSPHDDEIYAAFQEVFPNFKLDVIEEDSLKSEESKEKWRVFFLKFEHTVSDALFGSLVRMNCREGYSEANTIFVLKLQFLAIEIARNRNGLNDFVYEMHKK